jgi:adenylate cyclase
MEYSVIGDTVNVASRLCSLAKPGEIIVSESTYLRVKDQFEVAAQPPAQVRGKRDALRVFSVLGVNEGWTDEVTKPGM